MLVILKTLTMSDIDNHADYKASSVSVSVGSDAGGVNISGAGAGFDKGNASGTTKSAISSANVTITDEAKQQELSGKTAQETIASINTDTTNAHQKVDQIFDAAKVTDNVQASAQIMQSFTQYAPKAVADYASAKASELRKEGKEEEAKKWDEGGAYRVAAHTIVGGLAGDIAGALGAGTSAATIPAIGDMINSADLPSEVKQTLVALSGTAIGAAAGATTGDGGALTGGATGFAQTANNYLSHGQKDQRDKQLSSCKGDQNCIKAVSDYWKTIDKDTSMAEKIGEDIITAMKKGAEAYDKIVEKDSTNDPMLKILQLKIKANGDGDFNPKTAQDRFNTGMDLLKTDFTITNPYTIGGHPGLYNQGPNQ